MRARALALTLALAAPLAAACGPDWSQEEPLSQRFGDRLPIDVVLAGYQIRIPTSVEAGTVSFRVVNEGIQPHGFAVEGPGVDIRLERPLAPGESTLIGGELPPGDYVVYDPVGDHRDRGMAVPITAIEKTDN